jgi:hypothetical protein
MKLQVVQLSAIQLGWSGVQDIRGYLTGSRGPKGSSYFNIWTLSSSEVETALIIWVHVVALRLMSSPRGLLLHAWKACWILGIDLLLLTGLS